MKNTSELGKKGILRNEDRGRIVSTIFEAGMTNLMTTKIIKDQMQNMTEEQQNTALLNIMNNLENTASTVLDKTEFPEDDEYGFIDYSRIDSALNQ